MYRGTPSPLSINEEDPFYGFSIIRPSIYSTY